jgi:hypothetical protein
MTLAVTNSGINEVTHTTSGTLAYTTSVSNEIIVLFINSEPNAPVAPVRVSTVADTNGLVWNKRTSFDVLVNAAVNTYNSQEIWWAHAPAAVSGTITVTMASMIDGLAMIYASVSGCTNFKNPWNANVSLPDTTSNPVNSAVSPTLSVNTSGDAYVFGFFGTPVNSTETAGSGFTMIQGANFNNPTNWVGNYVEGAYFSTGQTGLAVAMANAQPGWGYIVDALSTAGSGFPYSQARVIA